MRLLRLLLKRKLLRFLKLRKIRSRNPYLVKDHYVIRVKDLDDGWYKIYDFCRRIGNNYEIFYLENFLSEYAIVKKCGDGKFLTQSGVSFNLGDVYCTDYEVLDDVDGLDARMVNLRNIDKEIEVLKVKIRDLRIARASLYDEKSFI